jgi:hypothetical protein
MIMESDFYEFRIHILLVNHLNFTLREERKV